MDTESGKTVGDEGVGAERIEVSPETRTRAERRTERAALRHRWPMNRDLFEGLSNEQMRIALGGEVVVKREYDAAGNVIKETRQHSSPKERTAAYKALVAADALNLEQERRDLEIPDFHKHEVVNAGELPIKVNLVDNWYGGHGGTTSAGSESPEPAAPSVAFPTQPGPVQSEGVRPPLGQDDG